MNNKLIIGFIGQGWIGKHYADDFEQRGFTVVRYSQEEPHLINKEKIKDCDIVFIAVPTPTTPIGFDDSIVRAVVKLVGSDKIAVIKSTIIPGTTESIQKENPGIFIFHSPEFLTESTAAHDVANPDRNIIGTPVNSKDFQSKAELVMSVLPKASCEKILPAREAELFKYLRNCFFFSKVVYMNMLYDLAEKLGCRWEELRDIMALDPWIGPMHIDPVHKSGRGAGGHCLIKDYAALVEMYKKLLPDDDKGLAVLEASVKKNQELLLNSNKDLDLLKGVYGNLN